MRLQYQLQHIGYHSFPVTTDRAVLTFVHRPVNVMTKLHPCSGCRSRIAADGKPDGQSCWLLTLLAIHELTIVMVSQKHYMLANETSF